MKLLATLATARIPIQIDIGFGDSVYPGPNEMVYPTMLDLPAPTLMVFPRETVVAEKYQAMVMLGIANSRMKDFYDLWILAQQFEFSGPVLSSAIRATFARRKTTLPEQTPLALTSEFTGDRQKLTQWRAFLRKGKLEIEGTELSTIAENLRTFLMPLTESLISGDNFELDWFPNGPWQAKTG